MLKQVYSLSSILTLPLALTSCTCVQERMEFDEPDFALIDTLFSLAEAHLFMQLIELQDNNPGKLPASKSCADIYRYCPTMLVYRQAICLLWRAAFLVHHSHAHPHDKIACSQRCESSRGSVPP